MDVIKKHGIDAFRYYFLRHADTFADADFTWDKFEEAYNNELANDLGNLVQRLATLAKKNSFTLQKEVHTELPEEYMVFMDSYEYSKAFDFAWGAVQALNRQIDEEKPWMLAKNGEIEKLNACLENLVCGMLGANEMLRPFLPGTTEKIAAIFTNPIEPPREPLFPKQ